MKAEYTSPAHAPTPVTITVQWEPRDAREAYRAVEEACRTVLDEILRADLAAVAL